MRRITIVWERIGRSRDVPDFVAEFDPRDLSSIEVLEHDITKHIARRLGSREFRWSVDVIDGGPISIDGGRFGRGVATIVDVAEVAA